MQESPLPAKIALLISQLQEEVRKLSLAHQAELNYLKEIHAIALHNLKDQSEQYIALVNDAYQTRIVNLESEIRYLTELNSSQRIMMEDNLDYIKGLEKKLDTFSVKD